MIVSNLWRKGIIRNLENKCLSWSDACNDLKSMFLLRNDDSAWSGTQCSRPKPDCCWTKHAVVEIRNIQRMNYSSLVFNKTVKATPPLLAWFIYKTKSDVGSFLFASVDFDNINEYTIKQALYKYHKCVNLTFGKAHKLINVIMFCTESALISAPR